jgi:DNA repair protein RecO (recombination protein O)
MIVQTDAVVLHAMDYRDTSKIVSLYTKKFGKIKVIAKGVRSQKNKFGSSLEPMTISSIVLYKKKHRDLHLLSKSEIAVVLNGLFANSDRMYTGLAVIELMNMVMHDEEENEKVYDMLIQALQTINDAENNHINVLLSFMIKVFDQFGFGLALASCSSCGRPVEEVKSGKSLLKLSDGKFVCQECAEIHQHGGIEIQGDILKSLYYFHANKIQRAPLLTVPMQVKNDMIATLQSYLQYHIEGTRTLRSLSLLYSTQ